MKKNITKSLLCAFAVFAASGATVFAEMKKISHSPVETRLNYGTASASDSSYGYTTRGKCNQIKKARVAVYVKDANLMTMASATINPGNTGSCTWAVSAAIPHHHYAASDLFS